MEFYKKHSFHNLVDLLEVVLRLGFDYLVDKLESHLLKDQHMGQYLSYFEKDNQSFK